MGTPKTQPPAASKAGHSEPDNQSPPTSPPPEAKRICTGIVDLPPRTTGFSWIKLTNSYLDCIPLGETYYHNQQTGQFLATRPEGSTSRGCVAGGVEIGANVECCAMCMKGRRRLSPGERVLERYHRTTKRRDSPVLLRLLEEIRRAQR